MFNFSIFRPIRGLCLLALLLAPVTAMAAEDGALHGTVTDPLGAVVVSATVELLDGTAVVQKTKTDAAGNYSFPLQKSARYQVRVVAPTFQSTTSNAVFVAGSGKAQIDVTLATQTLTQQVSVTATGTPTPEAQVGAPVSVLSADQYRYSTEVQDPLRLIPGAQVTQTGQVGGTTGLSIRGGNVNANKVLIDGVPADDMPYGLPAAIQPAGTERRGNQGNMLVEAALRNEHGDQDGFDYGAYQAAAADSFDDQPDQRRPADQHEDRHDATLAARRLAAGFTVELAVEECDRAAGEDDGMRDVTKDCRHVAEQRVDDEPRDEQQQRVGRQRRHLGRGRNGR